MFKLPLTARFHFPPSLSSSSSIHLFLLLFQIWLSPPSLQGMFITAHLILQHGRLSFLEQFNSPLLTVKFCTEIQSLFQQFHSSYSLVVHLQNIVFFWILFPPHWLLYPPPTHWPITSMLITMLILSTILSSTFTWTFNYVPCTINSTLLVPLHSESPLHWLFLYFSSNSSCSLTLKQSW